MKTYLKYWGITFAAFATLSASGCGGGNSGIEVPGAPIEARITTDKTTYRAGEIVRATVTFRNVSSTEQTLFSSSSNFTKISVSPAGQEQQIARCTTGLSYAQAPMTIRLAPGETTQGNDSVWDQTFNTLPEPRIQAPRGRYVLRSTLLQNPRDKVRDVTATITLIQ